MKKTMTELLEMKWKDISALSTSELRELSQRLNSAANKRLRRIEQAGAQEFSPAYLGTRAYRGDFSTKGLTTRTELKNEIQRATDFLSAKTSTVKGAREYRKTVEEMFTPDGEETLSIDELTKKQKNTIFRALDRIREANATLVYNVGSDVIIKELRKAQIENKMRNRYQLIKEVESRFKDLEEESNLQYEREEAERQSRTDEDGVFHTLTPSESAESPFRR